MKRGFFLTAALLLLFLVAPSCKKQGGVVLGKGAKAPDFTLYGTDGDAVSLSSLRGNVVLIEFFATWCPPCKDSVPELNELFNKFGGREFALLAVSVDEGDGFPDGLKAFKEEFGAEYPIVFDNMGINTSYNIMSIPTTFVLDKEGLVSSVHYGYSPGMVETLSEEIEELL